MRAQKAWVTSNSWQHRAVAPLSRIVQWQSLSDWLHRHKKGFSRAILYCTQFKIQYLFKISLAAKAEPSIWLSDANVVSSDS